MFHVEHLLWIVQGRAIDELLKTGVARFGKRHKIYPYIRGLCLFYKMQYSTYGLAVFKIP